MDPQKRLERTLEVNGAELIREGTHNVYRLNNGGQVFLAKTPSDHRSNLNAIRDIRRAGGEIPRFHQEKASRATQPIPTPTPPPPPPFPELPITDKLSLRARLEGAIADARQQAASLLADAERLSAEALRIEKFATKLEPLLDIAEEPEAEAILGAILLVVAPTPIAVPERPAEEPIPPPVATAQVMVEITTDRVERLLLGLAHDVLPELFTNDDLLLCLEPRMDQVTTVERQRAKNLLNGILHSGMTNRGLVALHKKGNRAVKAIWRRLDPTEVGTRIEI